MRRSLIRMISPTSLSAFSASIAKDGIATGAPSPTARKHQARAQSTAPAQSAAPTRPPQRPQGAAPGQFTPRGSLLDLTA